MTPMKIRPIVLALSIALASGLSLAALQARPGPPPAQDQAPKPAVVPFEMLPSNHMVVRATINGKGPYRLIFDLGSPVILLGSKAAEATGAIPKDAPKAFLFSTRGEGKIATLKVGDLTAKDLPVIVMDHPALKALGGLLGRPLDGIIGYTFFARYRTTIDYQTRQMTFTPVPFEVRDLMKDLPDRLLGPKVAQTRILAPQGLWGLTLGTPEGGVSSRGVPIQAVLPDSPAAAAGLKPGDLLTTLDGRWTTS
ncbi:MAG: aspartyl protease family protein, partial [Isosphaeraceae bacterium]|nr:aspartyl protease family protein [Isosphaeraceae bacterium]